jgi:ribosome-binding protein aMBF1 (putative translation factor)
LTFSQLTPKQRNVIGSLVRQARTKLKMPVAGLASRLGQPNELINKIEVGSLHQISTPVLERIEEILDIDIQEHIK